MALIGAAWATTLAAASPAVAGDESFVGSVSALKLRSPGQGGRLERFGTGGALSMLVLFHEGRDELTGGFEGRALFVRGRDGERLYDLGIGIMGSADLEGRKPAPFLSVGLDVAAVALPERGGSSRGLSAGLHGNLGVHGFASERIYWRGQVGYIGAGLGAINLELSLGWTF